MDSESIESQINQAVLAEREACAALADTYANATEMFDSLIENDWVMADPMVTAIGRTIANKIRNRSNEGKLI